MSGIEVRPFRRDDREQLTALVNAHAAAVVPGVTASVNAVMSQLEREPGEYIVDPWVSERVTLVAEQRQRIVAATHLLRYAAEEHVGESYRDSGEIRWFVFWAAAPSGNPYWPDVQEAADALLAASTAQLERWGVTRQFADGSLPVPGVYGVPEQWPHVRGAYERAGFVHTGHIEIVWLADVDDLPRIGELPLPHLELRRSLGINGTRLSGVLDDRVVGYIEVDTSLDDPMRLSRLGGWADVGNLHVDETYRRRGIATWLVAQAAEWLRLARVERLLDYAWPEQDDCVAFLATVGFRELTRTQRGWVREPSSGAAANPQRS